MKVVVVVPPFTKADWPSLGAEQVAAIGRTAGYDIDVYYACMLGAIDLSFADTAGAAGVFTPIYDGALDVPQYATELVDRLLRDQLHAEGARKVARMGRPQRIVKVYIRMIAEARRIVEQVVQELMPVAGPPRVIAFSVASDLQKMPSAAIAKALRTAGFEGRIVAGGSALDGDMGPAFLRRFPEFDAVLQGEVEDSWVPFLDAISSSLDAAATVPGSCVVRQGQVVQGPVPVTSDRFTVVGPPSFDSYLRQRRDSPMADLPVTLLAETSRSCWWGEKHQCLFCGVDSVSRPYRQKSVESAVQDLTTLWDTYRPDAVLLTDSIMPLKDMSKLLNELAIQNRERQWHLFYEVKSTLGRQAMARMACAGVAEIQPGIESFSSNTLRMMNKGATSLQQVNLLKWAKAYGVTVRYPILVGTPGETAADLRQVKSVLTSISHLDLPTQINRLALLKGSPYWAAPEATGIVDVRPREASEWIYQTDARSTLALEGQAAYRNPTWDTEEYQEALIDLEDTLDAMHRRINPMVSGYYRGDGAWVVTRSEYTGALTMEIISDATEVAILEASEQIGTRAGVARKLNKSLAELDIAVSALVERGLVLSDKDRLLALPLPFDASAAVDAEWPPTLVDLGAHT